MTMYFLFLIVLVILIFVCKFQNLEDEDDSSEYLFGVKYDGYDGGEK